MTLQIPWKLHSLTDPTSGREHLDLDISELSSEGKRKLARAWRLEDGIRSLSPADLEVMARQVRKAA